MTGMFEIQILINNFRAKHHMSQDKIAIVLGVSQSQISKWEKGKHSPTKLRIAQIRKDLDSYAKMAR